MSKEYTWINFDMNELFGVLMDLVHGDMWDGMMSKHHEKEYRECYRIFQERLDKLQHENERLRAALETLISQTEGNPRRFSGNDVARMVRIAIDFSRQTKEPKQ